MSVHRFDCGLTVGSTVVSYRYCRISSARPFVVPAPAVMQLVSSHMPCRIRAGPCVEYTSCRIRAGSYVTLYRSYSIDRPPPSLLALAPFDVALTMSL